MLQHFMEDLRRLELAAQILGHGSHHTLEPLIDPTMSRDFLAVGVESDLDPE